MAAILSCADCKARNCLTRKNSFPEFCLTTGLDEETIHEVTEKYMRDGEDNKMARTAAILESEFYCIATRVEEMLIFIKRMGYKKVGIASCIALLNECGYFTRAARAKGIDLYAVACKAGGVDKSKLDIPEEKKIKPNQYEPICNPILQAEILNREQTEFNIIIGLCVGHDTLFIKHSKAPVSYLIVKDRVLCHNPAAALYNMDSYYHRLLEPDISPPRAAP